MAKRFSDTEIWRKDWYLDLSIKQKLLLKFLFDNCDCAGIYEISYRTLKYCFNEEITRNDFEGLKQIRFIDDNTIFIEDFIKFQYNCEISDLRPDYRVHKGIISKLNKYGILETLNKGLCNTYKSVLDKEKDKDNIVTYNYQTDTIDIDKVYFQKKKFDPYINPIKTFFIEEYSKIFGNKPMLSNQDCNRLVELSADNSDIRELIPIAIARLKCIKFGDIGFKPTANWLLKENNFERVINGEFGKKTPFDQQKNILKKMQPVEITPEDEKKIAEINEKFWKKHRRGL